MTGRYDRGDPVSLYHHQKSHYQHIFNPRATMRIEVENRQSLSIPRKNKSTSEKDRQRRIQNKKMLVNLLDIYNHKPGLLTRVEEESRSKSSQKKRPLYSSYKKEQQEKEIQKNNRDLFYSILHTGPSIGTQKEWDQHYEKHCIMQKKLCSHTNDYHGLNQFRQSYTKEKMRKKMGQDSGRQAYQAVKEQGVADVPPVQKFSQRKKKWLKKKAHLIEKGLNSTEKVNNINNETPL